MATVSTQQTLETAVPAPAVIRAVQAPAAICGDCMFHIPHATRPNGWCTCDSAKSRWQPVAVDGAVCADYASWPEGSPVPAFLAAMRF